MPHFGKDPELQVLQNALGATVEQQVDFYFHELLQKLPLQPVS